MAYSLGIVICFFFFSLEVCELRLFDIYVGLMSDDFIHSAALLCARNQTAGIATSGIVKCLQPVEGRFVTIVNLRHIYSEPLKRWDRNCLQLCEVEVFAEGEKNE